MKSPFFPQQKDMAKIQFQTEYAIKKNFKAKYTLEQHKELWEKNASQQKYDYPLDRFSADLKKTMKSIIKNKNCPSDIEGWSKEIYKTAMKSGFTILEMLALGIDEDKYKEQVKLLIKNP